LFKQCLKVLRAETDGVPEPRNRPESSYFAKLNEHLGLGPRTCSVSLHLEGPHAGRADTWEDSTGPWIDQIDSEFVEVADVAGRKRCLPRGGDAGDLHVPHLDASPAAFSLSPSPKE